MIITRDGLFRFVCSIANPQGGVYKTGTGLFVCSPSKAGRSFGWIVTANHVAKKANSGTLIGMTDENGKTVEKKLTFLGDLKDWKHHPVADISAFPIYFNDANRAILSHRFISIDHFLLQRTDVSRDCELTVVGFPKSLGCCGNFSPFTFRTYPSSDLIRHQRLDTGVESDFFCLEHPGVGGYSGAPVMDLGYTVVKGEAVHKKEKSLVCGIFHGTLSDRTGGKIALVTPSYYLKDIIKTENKL